MKRMKLIPFFILAFTTALTGCSKSDSGTYQQVSPQEAISMMETEEDYIILDVRTPEEFDAGHIPNAVNLPNESISTAPTELLPEKDQLILVYCRSGNRSKQASGKLAKLGYTNIVEFGGINHWPGALVTD